MARRHDPYEKEYGPSARRRAQVMNRYYASVNRAIKRALKEKKSKREMHDVLGAFNRNIAKELRQRRRRARHAGGAR